MVLIYSNKVLIYVIILQGFIVNNNVLHSENSNVGILVVFFIKKYNAETFLINNDYVNI